ncbi:peptidoglycan DD-metalloendopeptidase family protein [Chryseobacterium sp. YIM B08800]|uniref:peptidoglycan DD-metalloendopeptidase family protein n=1 Tax=Chryseobacterium sp. YIM B08800 TaxID=2984136 RepID=UPI00223EACD6|nr:peptidoglycan DD-metalloendopeptidase family protein [Chryseobacterium sp. YIM B08800]
MKIRILIVLFLHINCWMFSQYSCPLNSGRIILNKPNFYGHQDETNNRIKSESNQVISISNGKVAKIIKSDSDYSLIIKNDTNNFFIYSNLSKTMLKENDTVEKSQILGLANYDEYYASYLLGFQFWKKDESIKVDLECTKSD